MDPGRYLLRLKQIDFAGAFEFSPQVEVEVEVPGTHLLVAAYPNPFDRSTSIQLAVAREQRVRVDIFGPRGRLVDVLFDGRMAANETRHFTIDGSRW